MNPFYDSFILLKQGRWPIFLLWLLLLARVLIAAYNLKRNSAQRTFKQVWIWIARVLLGCMWWQQTLWKLPPFKEPGLRYWMEQLVKYAAFGRDEKPESTSHRSAYIKPSEKLPF